MDTIRDRLKRRTQRILLIAACFCLGACIGFSRLPLLTYVLVLIVLNAISFSIAFALVRLTRCPVCNARLGSAARKVTKDHPTVDNCPHCGVSFDESIGKPEGR